MPLYLLDSVLFTNSQAFLKAYFIYILLYKCILFFLKIVHYYVNKTCRIFLKLLFCRQFCRQSARRRRHYQLHVLITFQSGGQILIQGLGLVLIVLCSVGLDSESEDSLPYVCVLQSEFSGSNCRIFEGLFKFLVAQASVKFETWD